MRFQQGGQLEPCVVIEKVKRHIQGLLDWFKEINPRKCEAQGPMSKRRGAPGAWTSVWAKYRC